MSQTETQRPFASLTSPIDKCGEVVAVGVGEQVNGESALPLRPGSSDMSLVEGLPQSAKAAGGDSLSPPPEYVII